MISGKIDDFIGQYKWEGTNEFEKMGSMKDLHFKGVYTYIEMVKVFIDLDMRSDFLTYSAYMFYLDMKCNIEIFCYYDLS